MWFQSKENKVLKEILTMLELIQVTLAKHEVEIDLIHTKLLKKKSTGRPKAEEEPETETPLYDDGFNKIREFNKQYPEDG